MSEPNVKGPFIVEIKKNGLMEVNISEWLCLWEMDNDEETEAEYISVDPKPSGGRIRYEDIPLVIHYLNKVYEKRVVKNERKLNTCPHCGNRL